MNDMQTVHFSANESNSEVTPKHDARLYTPPNAEATLEGNNVYIKTTIDLKAAVNERMWDTIEEFNGRQKRADRKMDHDVYTKLRDGGKNTKPVLEFVVGIGNRETCGITDNDFDGEHWANLKEAGKFDEAAAYVDEHLNRDPRLDDAKQVLVNFAERFPERFPNFEVVGAYVHADEPNAGLHMHLQVIPISTNEKEGGYKRGTKEQISYKGACHDAGFKTHTERRRDPKSGKMKNMRITEQQAFEEAARDFLAEDAAEFGFERDFKGGGNKRKNIHAFKTAQQEKEAKERIEAAKAKEAEALANAKAVQDAVDEYAVMVEETTEALKEREAAAQEKEAHAQDMMAAAETKDAEAEKKAAEAEEKVERITKREEDVAAKEEQLLQAAIDADAEAKAREEEADAYAKAKIAEAEEAAKAAAEKALKERTEAIEAREEAVKKAEDEIEQKVARAKHKVEAAEKKADEILTEAQKLADEVLVDKENAIAEREKAVEEKEEKLQEEKAAFEVREQEQAEEKKRIETMKQKLEETLASVEALRKEFAARLERMSENVTKALSRVVGVMQKHTMVRNGREQTLLNVVASVMKGVDKDNGGNANFAAFDTIVQASKSEEMKEHAKRMEQVARDFETMQQKRDDERSL